MDYFKTAWLRMYPDPLEAAAKRKALRKELEGTLVDQGPSVDEKNNGRRGIQH